MSTRDEYHPSAYQVPFDNETNGFQSEDVQGAIEEIGAAASPGFQFSRPGSISSQKYLYIAGGVVSSRAGVPVFINNATVDTVVATNEDPATYQVKVYSHDGDKVNLTLLTTLQVTNSRTTIFSNVGVSVAYGKQIAIRIKPTGTVKNCAVSLKLKGTV